MSRKSERAKELTEAEALAWIYERIAKFDVVRVYTPKADGSGVQGTRVGKCNGQRALDRNHDPLDLSRGAVLVVAEMDRFERERW